MFRESADLLEAFPVDELFHTLACREQASRVMLFDPRLAASLLDLRSLVAKFRDLSVYRRFRRGLLLRNFFQFKTAANRIRGHYEASSTEYAWKSHGYRVGRADSVSVLQMRHFIISGAQPRLCDVGHRAL